MHALTLLFTRWTAEAAEPLPPLPPELVKKVFTNLGSLATEDVLTLYGTLGGMLMMDNECWRLWSLSEIEEQTPSEFGVLFSDYLISSWEYRLKPVSPYQSAVYVDHFDGRAPTLVATTLEEFFERYTTSALELLEQS